MKNKKEKFINVKFKLRPVIGDPNHNDHTYSEEAFNNALEDERIKIMIEAYSGIPVTITPPSLIKNIVDQCTVKIDDTIGYTRIINKDEVTVAVKNEYVRIASNYRYIGMRCIAENLVDNKYEKIRLICFDLMNE